MAEVITKKGAVLPLHAHGSTTFGTDDDVAVTVAREFAVADRHFTILPEGGGYVLKDLQSGLGTKVNSEGATTRLLVHGDRIHAGKLELRFSDPSPNTAANSDANGERESGGTARTKAAASIPALPALQLQTSSAPVPEAAAEKKSLLAFAFGKKKKTKLVLPTIPKKKPLQKPLIKREVIRIPVAPDPNNPPRTIVNRLLGKERKRYQPELKLISITEKSEAEVTPTVTKKSKLSRQASAPKAKLQPEPTKKAPVVVAESVPKKPSEPVVPAIPVLPPLVAKQSADQPPQRQPIETAAPQSPAIAPVAPIASIAAKTESTTELPKKAKKRNRPPLSAIVRKQVARVCSVLVGCCKAIPAAISRVSAAFAPVFALPANAARGIVKFSTNSFARLQSWARNVSAAVAAASKATRTFALSARNGTAKLSRVKDVAIRRCVSIGKTLAVAGVGIRGSVQSKVSAFRQRNAERAAVPVAESVSVPRRWGKTSVGILVSPRQSGDEPRPGVLDGWWQAIGVGSAIATITVGIVWDSQNEQVLFGLLSQYTGSKQPTLVISDRNQNEPAVAASKPRFEYPVTESDHLTGTWIAVETVNHGAQNRTTRIIHPGSAFRFERWGGLKMLTGAGRKDGQRLSDVEALGLQVHFQASYEIAGPGLVVFHTEDGDLLFSASRQQDRLGLALLDPASHEPVVELLCLPNRKLKR